MSKYLFHGDNLAGSRAELNLLIAKEKQLGKEIIFLDGLKLAPKDLGSTLASANLFSSTTIVIENLFSRPIGSDRKKLLSIVKEYEGDKNLLFWEKKEISKSNLANLAKTPNQAKIFLAKTPALIFKFLDSLAPGHAAEALALLHQTVLQVEDGFIFVMLSRHVADLLIAQSGDSSKLIPFKRTSLIQQASLFPPNSLFIIHDSLLNIDRSLKTGLTKLSYIDHLDLLLVSLLN